MTLRPGASLAVVCSTLLLSKDVLLSVGPGKPRDIAGLLVLHRPVDQCGNLVLRAYGQEIKPMQPLAVSIALSPRLLPPFLSIPSSLRPPFPLLDPQKQIYKIRGPPTQRPNISNKQLDLGLRDRDL